MTFPQRLARISLILALLVPIYFAIAGLGSKFGLWGYSFGLGTLTITGGPILLGTVALIALVALIWTLLRKPRAGWWRAAIALLIPVLAFITLGGVGDRAGQNPLYDVATDTDNPPTFSTEMMERRAAADANEVNDYSVPLSEYGKWEGERFGIYNDRTHRQIIDEIYPGLDPIITGATIPQAVEAVTAAMNDAGYDGVTANLEAGRVEGTQETFWYGFKDDVVARIVSTGEGVRIDFRSVSRVGLSDLGANAQRLTKLREATQANLS